VRVDPPRRPQDRVAIAAAGRDDVRVGDRDVVQLETDDRGTATGELPAGLDLLGFPVGDPRAPLLPLDD
jgi:4-hydroxy-tetrahydrodipicolinate synthase